MKHYVIFLSFLLLYVRLNSFLQISNSTAGTIISQVSSYCIEHELLDFECAKVFVDLIESHYTRNISFFISLQDVPIFHFSTTSNKLIFQLYYDQGSINSQVDKFCSLYSCSLLANHKIKSYFANTTSHYWFPTVDLILRQYYNNKMLKKKNAENIQENIPIK